MRALPTALALAGAGIAIGSLSLLLVRRSEPGATAAASRAGDATPAGVQLQPPTLPQPGSDGGRLTALASAPVAAPDPLPRFGINVGGPNAPSQREILFADAFLRMDGFRLADPVTGAPQLGAPATTIAYRVTPQPRLGEGYPDPGDPTNWIDGVSCRLFVQHPTVPGNGGTSDPDVYVVYFEGDDDAQAAGGTFGDNVELVSDSGMGLTRVGTTERRFVSGRMLAFQRYAVDPSVGGGPNGQNLYLRLRGSRPSNPVRNIHVWLPGMFDFGFGRFRGTRVLWPPWVALAKSLNDGSGPDIVRPLDLMRPNAIGQLVHPMWDDDDDGRGLGASISGAFDRLVTPDRGILMGRAGGVAPEFVVAIANELDADLHITVHHQARDRVGGTDVGPPDAEYLGTYVRSFLLETIRDGSAALPDINDGAAFAGLEPGRELWIEFANECWNAEFNQTLWLSTHGQAVTGETFGARYAAEALRIWAEADQVFGAAGYRRYLGASAPGANFLDNAFIEVEANPLGGGGTGDYRIDGAGPSFYWGPRLVDLNDWCSDIPTSLPDVDDVLFSGVRAANNVLRIQWRDHRELVDQWNARGYGSAADHGQAGGQDCLLYFYEGMNNFVPDRSDCPVPIQPVFHAAEEALALWTAFVDGIPGAGDGVLQVLEGDSIEADVLLFYRFVGDQDPSDLFLAGWGAFDRLDDAVAVPASGYVCDEEAGELCRPKAALLLEGPSVLSPLRRPSSATPAVQSLGQAERDRPALGD